MFHLKSLSIPKLVAICAACLLFGLGTIPARAADAVVGTGTAASCSEAAFDAALVAAQAGGGAITFNCGGPATITFQTGKIVANAEVAIDGGGAVTLSGLNKVRPFYVDSNAALALRNITLSNGLDTTYGGGAVINLGELALTNTTIRNSNVDATHSGGAIMSLGPVTIDDSTIENNSGGSAGGLYLFGEAADATITNSTFRNNRTTSATYGLGGAITTWNGADLTVRGSTLDQNSGRSGGAIYNESALTTIVVAADTMISGNEATDDNGGGIYNVGGTLGLTDVTLAGNQSRFVGGGIFNKSGSLTATNIVFNNNSAYVGGGGGVSNHDASATLTNAIFRENSSYSSGGGIGNGSSGILVVRDSTLANNTSEYGGGVSNSGVLSMFNVTISGNSAFEQGGGVLNSGKLTLFNATISGNSGSDGGGLLGRGTINLVHVTFSENESGIYQAGTGVFTLKNVLLHGSTDYNCQVQSGPSAITSAGFNLSSDSSCPFNQTGDRVNVDPRLGPLADNGGFSRTHMLLPDSPAIDAGQCVGNLPTDQRGLPRLQGSSCDIGALERQPDDNDRAFLLFLPAGLK